MNKQEIKKYIEDRSHWKKGVSYWGGKLGVDEDIIREALDMEPESTQRTSNANDGVEERIEEKGVAQSYEEFLEKHGIDRKDVTNVWFKEKVSGTYFSVETRTGKTESDIDEAEEFKKSIEEYSPPSYSFEKPSEVKSRAAIISIFDAHIDKLSLIAETDKERDINDNVILFEEAFDDLLDGVASKKPEIIYFPIGNDFYHTNDHTLSTKKGTYMGDRVHTTDMEAFRIGFNLLRRCIDKARQVASEVVVIPMRGNHDQDRVHYLLEMMLVTYENQVDVRVVDSRKSRLYERYGSWLFGFAHGDKERKAADLPSLMSTDKDARQHWAEIDQGIYFLGDIHHEKRFDFMKSQDFRGCKVMFLRSISTTDEWHWSNGYTAIPKSAYAFVYDKDGKHDYEIKINI